jgi:uncharacterized protein
MKSQIFINLPVSNLEKSVGLYGNMGFTINPQFSDNTAKCMVFSEEIFLMIMTIEKFKTFTNKPLADTKNVIAGLFALSVEGVDRVNEIADKAVLAGGIEPKPFQDYGFMQQRTIEDFDGHTWEIFYMDLTKFPQQ